GLEFQPELFLQRRKDRRTAVGHSRRISPASNRCVRRERQLDIVRPGQGCAVDDRASLRNRQHRGKRADLDAGEIDVARAAGTYANWMIALSCRLVNVTPPGVTLMLVCVVPDWFKWTDTTSNAFAGAASGCSCATPSALDAATTTRPAAT